MKTLLLVASLALAATTAWADSVTGGTFFNLNTVVLPAGGGNNVTTGTPWFNQGSDGTGNVAQFLNASQNFNTQTQYVSAAGAGQYYGTNATTATTFSFLQGASTISVAVLYANAGQNFGSNFGTKIGIYQILGGGGVGTQTQVFGPGSLWNGSGDCIGTAVCNAGNTINGLFNAGNGGAAPPSAAGVGTFASWGIYATTCTSSNAANLAAANCTTYFSSLSGDDSVTTSPGGVSTIHQHFALFQAGANATTFFVGFEDFRGTNSLEGSFGDYNDVILQITTGAAVVNPLAGVPEPGTLSVLGLGLIGLGALRKFRKS